MKHPLARSAAIVAYTFGQFPDQALACDQRTWRLRVAATHIVQQSRRRGSPGPKEDD